MKKKVGIKDTKKKEIHEGWSKSKNACYEDLNWIIKFVEKNKDE
tara:strand:- start:47488 stop:47619 length:132 start_codon:yes stop_codon:yes gene_type:complete